MESALRLERHFFTRIELCPDGEAKPEGKYQVQWTLALAQASDDANRYQVTLTVRVNQDPASTAKTFYTGVFEIVGFFTVAKGCPQEPSFFVQVSGASLLYSAVRELVCNLTARGPWPMISLPTVNFTPQPEAFVQTKVAETAASEKK
jgi:preprotein translocase subunit SecB